MTTSDPTIPISIQDPINASILAVSEDKIQGFVRDPLGHIARESGVDIDTVIERLKAMLQGGTIRRIRQTLMATNLAPGSLVAWQVPAERLNEAFDYMVHQDPFSGHVVIRTTDNATAGSNYRLWTTLKVPQGFSMTRHCDYLSRQVGAEHYRLMPAKRLFALGVGHVRRRGMEPGARSPELAEAVGVNIVRLTDAEWNVLVALKREFEVHEIQRDIWHVRAVDAGISLDEFHRIAESLHERGVIGRFSTFLEHVKKLQTGETVTRYNALFHWAVPPGREIDAGREVGRHHIMTHAYWREGGPEFRNVNVMGVAHGLEKEVVLAHKAAIDQHLAEAGIAVSYTNVFWGGRSEIKPSEIAPQAYVQWCRQVGLDPAQMRE